MRGKSVFAKFFIPTSVLWQTNFFSVPFIGYGLPVRSGVVLSQSGKRKINPEMQPKLLVQNITL